MAQRAFLASKKFFPPVTIPAAGDNLIAAWVTFCPIWQQTQQCDFFWRGCNTNSFPPLPFLPPPTPPLALGILLHRLHEMQLDCLWNPFNSNFIPNFRIYKVWPSVSFQLQCLHCADDWCKVLLKRSKNLKRAIGYISDPPVLILTIGAEHLKSFSNPINLFTSGTPHVKELKELFYLSSSPLLIRGWEAVTVDKANLTVT